MKTGSGLPPKLSPTVQKIIDEAMCQDDKTTAGSSGSTSNLCFLAAIVRNLYQLGWIYRGTTHTASKQNKTSTVGTNEST